MSVAQFLNSRRPYVALCVAASVAVAFFMLICQVSWQMTLFATVTVLACCIAALALDWAGHRRFWKDLDALIAGMQHAKDLPAFVEPPRLPDQALAFDALRCTAHVASSDVAKARHQEDEYREYVESWIHEVKTPLAAAGLLAARVPGSDGSAIARELEMASRSVEQALWYARSTNANGDYLIRRVSLAALAREACKRNARFLIEQGIVPTLNISDDVFVSTDEKWALFIVTQAVVNAAKYGASRVEFSIEEHQPDTSDAATVLVIADDGWGIPAADVPRVFDRGFTGELGRKAGSSTGMGLYLSALMANRLGLGLTLTSEEGTGTRVALSFPHDYRHLD